MNTREIFASLRNALEEARSQQDSSIATSAANSFGFVESDESRNFTFAVRYSYTGSDGYSIVLNYRSYDPSGPFQNLPDINKFSLTLVNGGSEEDSYSCSFEDPR